MKEKLLFIRTEQRKCRTPSKKIKKGVGQAIAAETEKLRYEIEEIGSLWLNEKEAENKLSIFKTIKVKRATLKTQLKFREKVIGISCNKDLFYLSSKGRIRSPKQLLENLMYIFFFFSTN